MFDVRFSTVSHGVAYLCGGRQTCGSPEEMGGVAYTLWRMGLFVVVGPCGMFFE